MLVDPSGPTPVVSVIVPARNEEDCLGRCLQSLVTQEGVEFEVIVVDDHSTDRTGQIARSFQAVWVLESGPLPEGWTGKSHALNCGVKRARGRWFLFTDADTCHKAGSLARAFTEVRERGADLLSYSPEQEVCTLLEKAVMPVIFAELAVTYRPAEVSDPRSSAAAANGQYVLVTRQAYEAAGGHAAVAGVILEDVALARRVKESGGRILFRFGGEQVSTRMYRTAGQLIEGWSKNLVFLFPSPIRLAALRLLEFLSILAVMVLTVALFIHRDMVIAGVCGVVVAALVGRFVSRILKAHFQADATALAFFGLPFFSYLLCRSVISYRSGRLNWKGRSYSGAAAS
jgi:hypothetical protein